MLPQFWQSKSTTWLIVFLVFIVLLMPELDADLVKPTGYIGNYCFDEVEDQGFQINVNLLLQYNLSLETSRSRFYNFRAGVGNATEYGLYLCKGFVSQQVCHDSVASSTQYLAQACANHWEGIVWSKIRPLTVVKGRPLLWEKPK